MERKLDFENSNGCENFLADESEMNYGSRNFFRESAILSLKILSRFSKKFLVR